MKKVISTICLLCAITACNDTKSFKPVKYAQYLEDAGNNFLIKQTIGIHEYNIQLATAEYMVVKELENTDSAALLYPKRLNDLKAYVFFLIKIGTTEKSRIEAGGKRMSEQQLTVNDRVSYYDQQAVLDISLTKGSTTLKPATYLFENNYDLAPYNTIVVGFETSEQIEDLTLTFNDRYAQIPAIRASFSKESLQKIPKLEI